MAETGVPGARATGATGWTLNRFLIVLGWLAFAVHMVYLTELDPAHLFRGDVMFFFAPMTVATVALLFWTRPWLELTAAILVGYPAALSLLLFDGFSALADPTKGGDHRDAVLNLMSILFALPAGVLAFRARKGRAQHALGAGWVTRQGVFAVGAIALLVGMLGTGMLTGAAIERAPAASGYDFAPDERVTVVLEEFAFVPQDVVLEPDVVTEIVVENRDTAFHTLTYRKDGVEYEHDVIGGATTRFLVRFEETGTFPFWCAPHAEATADGYEGMVGAFVVT